MTIKISGKVIRGEGKGKKIGFPTVNIRLDKKMESGVYSGIAKTGGREYRTGVFIAPDGENLEAYLIGFSGDLYGEVVEIDIHEKIRDVEKFRDTEELREQVQKDIKIICNP